MDWLVHEEMFGAKSDPGHAASQNCRPARLRDLRRQCAEANVGLATSRAHNDCVTCGLMDRDGNDRIGSVKHDACRTGARRVSDMTLETRITRAEFENCNAGIGFEAPTHDRCEYWARNYRAFDPNKAGYIS